MDPLHKRLREELPQLEELQRDVRDHWGVEDLVYRFYHGSFKTYRAQELTARIFEALQEIMPESVLDARFRRIIDEGTGKTFSPEANRRWDENVRPIIEALLHATYFLDMAVECAKDEEPGTTVRSGYAALLGLYGLR